MQIVNLDARRHPDELTARERAHMRLMTVCSRLNEVSMGAVDTTMLDDLRRLLDEAGEAVEALEGR